MKLFIAEKPDLAKAILTGIDGDYQSGNGYYQKGDNIVTYAFGHILELYMPEDYDERFKIWRLEDLPLEIRKFEYKPIANSKKQLKIICDLIKDSRITEIINCGDADEEGQILIDEIINYSKIKKPIFRLLLQDLTEKGVRAALKNIKPNSEFKGLSECGFARSQADWIVGINLTRAYTKAAGNRGYQGVLSVGRVQTPILGLVVNRDLEHENHKISFYYNIDAQISTPTPGIFIPMRYKSDEKIEDQNIANKILTKVQGKRGIISNAIHENKKEYAPLPYNLLLLQADCSKKFGYKPDKTLKITQDLRERHKAITYNRSDCQYLPENLFEECPNILNQIKSNLQGIEYLIDNCDTGIKSYAFNDKNITAHYAIIPTATKTNNLSKEEANVYELIVKRFIAQFYAPMEYIQSNIEATIENEKFFVSSKRILKNGYKLVFGALGDDEDEQKPNEVNIDLSSIKSDEIAIANSVTITKEQTKPKPYYIMASLLKDLTSVSKFVKDEKVKKLLQEKDKDKKGENGGIGTPATRSDHIKKLFDRGFIEEKGKSIISTKLGREFFGFAPKILTSPDMTALWYEEQKEIISGLKSRDEFLLGIKQVVANEIKKISANSDIKISSSFPKCPKCGEILVRRESKNKKGKFYWGCSNFKNCNIGFFNDDKGKPVLQKAQTTTKEYKCPTCGKGHLIKRIGKKGFFWGCSEWKPNNAGCNAVFLDQRGEPIFTKNQDF
ncbi:DNA topoisomerase III [Campylobacter fetus subsp. testudinum]|uniref:DNA topoisomerase 3 n=1 Tax=Campylobacter fetus TaxID=196 RepID=UPI000818BFFD|nr:DNA topoisomerase 3 [Campylobacter fetus]OCR87742.1 DNA topoisomerase III [Campylobacter fetus subsp. testudinum]OCR98912.1 DNA topoisomerase III [Campylobacter fetus subsp. testudinum]